MPVRPSIDISFMVDAITIESLSFHEAATSNVEFFSMGIKALSGLGSYRLKNMSCNAISYTNDLNA